MPSFILRNLDPIVWSRVQAKAAAEGITVKALILRLLAQWLGVVLLVLLPIACAYHAPDAPTPTLPNTTTVPFALNLGASPGATAGSTVLTAKVQAGNGAALSGIVVSFSTDIGSLSPSSVTTPANGQAVSTLTSPSGSSSAVTVTAGPLSTRLLVTPPAAVPVTPPLPPPVVPTPPAPTPPPPLTVTIVATARQAGTASDFTLATSTISSATWSFGDGTPAVTTFDPFVSHTYAAAGVYTAGVTVTDTLGRMATATQSVTIIAATPVPPPALLSASISCPKTTSLTLNCNVSATSNGTTLLSSAITRVDWDFGDGFTEFTVTPAAAVAAHGYPQPGTYTVFATIRAALPFPATTTETATTSTSVTVPSPP